MAKNLWSYSRKDKIVEYRIQLSKDWYTLTPWSRDGKIMPYFGRHVEIKSVAKITTYLIGPFIFQIGEVA